MDYVFAVIGAEVELNNFLRGEFFEVRQVNIDFLLDHALEDAVENTVEFGDAEAEGIELSRHIVLGVAKVKLSDTEVGVLG